MNAALQIIKDDPYLKPYEQEILDRNDRFQRKLENIIKRFDSLKKFASWHDEMGLNFDARKRIWTYREWAPGAEKLALVGDFNNWDSNSHLLQKNSDGIWGITLKEAELASGDVVKVRVIAANGTNDRLPAFSFFTVQNPENHEFKTQVLKQSSFKWTDKSFKIPKEAPFIYECHIGMAQERHAVGTYREFADNILPRVKALGYNFIQTMAIMEHPYYGSFGYHVSSFFAPSSRMGSPDDLRYLINEAHGMGIGVILDIVHSHAVKNFSEGLSHFDGTEGQYFHAGGKGYHNTWDSMLFDYGKEEVQRFLLSNLKYWMESFHFDGFRFDGITSMLYHHHGDMVSFDSYDKYFKDGVDWDAIIYLQLANQLIHEVNKSAISIAEDMSGMPGLCRKIEDGGIGFDYRLGMGLPDFWIKYLKERRDEDWNVSEMWYAMNNRREFEKTVSYVESHDQAMVGDKTTAFWLMDKEMYHAMAIGQESLIIDRGIALHKLMRALTSATGGEAYMNFIGNEFGHPEWIDFPRAGNNWSYQYARRQWSLVDNVDLKYKYLNNFDIALIQLLKKHKILQKGRAQVLNLDETNNCIAFSRGDLVFIFNFHPTRAIPNYQFPVPKKGVYSIVLNSDAKAFGGFDRIDENQKFSSIKKTTFNSISIYLTNRTCLVFELNKPGKKLKSK